MNANELRIGNWVNHETLGLLEWEYTHFDDYVKDLVEGCIISDTIEPIPLTPEILEAAGFEKTYEHQQGIEWFKIPYSPNKFTTREFTLKRFIKRHGGEDDYVYLNTAHPKYLHELQNIFQAMTGTELTINLTEKVNV